MPHLSNVSHHCLDTGCAVCSSGNVCLIAEMFVCGCVWLLIAWFYSKVLTEPSVLLTLTDSHSEQHPTHPSVEFSVQNFTALETCVLHAMALFTAWSPGTPRVTPWVPPSLPHTRGNTGHSNLSWKLDIKARCPNVVTSSTHSWRIQMASLRPGPMSWTWLWIPLYFPPELSYALPSWEVLSYVLRDYLIRIPPHEPTLIPRSFTHSEVRPLMTWVRTCNCTFCSV